MISRSRMLFWGLTAILVLLLLLVTGAVGYRTHMVNKTMKSLESHEHLDVFFDYVGPAWLKDVLPQAIANTWFSTTYIEVTDSMWADYEINDQVWLAAQPNISRLPNLTNIGFWHVDAGQRTLESLSAFPNLRHISLFDAQIVDDDLEFLSNCSRITSLNLANNPITDAGLVHLSGLSNLNYLNLDGTQVTEDGLVHLRGLTNLKELSVSNTGLPESAIQSLQADMPGLMISDD